MEKKTKIQKPEKPTTTRRRPSLSHTAEEKCRAVLSVWSERRKPSEVCRELSVQWSILEQWQNRAMEGMLQALEPRINLDRGPALPPRLASLIEKRCLGKSGPEKLMSRLAQVRQQRSSKTEEPVAENAT